jgi:hypothetical protein
MRLDGEMFAGRGKWEASVAAVVRNQWTPEIFFIVFDAPEIEGSWSKRIRAASQKAPVRLCRGRRLRDDARPRARIERLLGIIAARSGENGAKTRSEVASLRFCDRPLNQVGMRMPEFFAGSTMRSHLSANAATA